MKLTETERWTVINALRVAAVAYAADASVVNNPRLREHFQQQTDDANRLATRIEEAEED